MLDRRLAATPRAQRALAELAGRPLNFDPVEFRVHVVSRRARAGNPLLRLGFRLLGRREQVRFAQRACGRMGELVERELACARSARPNEPGAAQLAP